MDLLLQIIQLAAGIAQQHAAGTVVAKDAAIAEQLAGIAQAANAAYTQHMGQPLDEGMIQPETELP